MRASSSQGFRHVLDGMNAERVLIASECVGDGRWFVDKVSRTPSERIVFGRPVGANQARSSRSRAPPVAVDAASLVRFKAAWLYDQGEPCAPEANMAKLLAV